MQEFMDYTCLNEIWAKHQKLPASSFTLWQHVCSCHGWTRLPWQCSSFWNLCFNTRNIVGHTFLSSKVEQWQSTLEELLCKRQYRAIDQKRKQICWRSRRRYGDAVRHVNWLAGIFLGVSRHRNLQLLLPSFYTLQSQDCITLDQSATTSLVECGATVDLTSVLHSAARTPTRGVQRYKHTRWTWYEGHCTRVDRCSCDITPRFQHRTDWN